MAAAQKLDLYKIHKAEYVAAKKPVLVKIKAAKYLTISGKGKPASADFQNKIGALYGVAFTVKMAKRFAGKDYKVCHLEGLWWGDGKSEKVLSVPPSSLHWTLLIRVPDFIQKKDIQAAIIQLLKRGKAREVSQVELEKISEGQCVQMLHVGPYNEESGTLAQMMEFAREKGLSCRGRHHEIYLSDPRRVPAARLRTILRHPVG